MAVQFRRETGDNRPPNYGSRRVQVRLLILVSLFMLVIIAADKARDPKYYAWMWQLQGPQTPVSDSALEEGEVETVLPPIQENEESRVANEIVPGNRRPSATPPQELEVAKSGTPFQRLQWDAWGETLQGLSEDDYQQLLRGMVASRNWIESSAAPERSDEAAPFAPADPIASPRSARESWRQGWSTLVMRLDENWQDYFTRTREFLKDTPTSEPLTGVPLEPEAIAQQTAERQAWAELIERLENHWRNVARPALASLDTGPPISAAHRQILHEIQSRWDEMAMQKVSDDTMGLRKVESDAWFRILELLKRASPEDLRRQSEETVGYLQLFDQPKDYRGKLVTIRGTARQGYRVDAPPNAYGIDEYHIFWIQPAGGPNSPFVVYALETPVGMPPLKHRDRDDGGTELNHEVEITGYFFKRYGYLAQDQPRSCPLLLAKLPVFEADETELPVGATFSVWKFGLAIVMAALVGVAIATLVLLSSRGKPTATNKFMSQAGKPKPPTEEQIKASLAEVSTPPLDETP